MQPHEKRVIVAEKKKLDEKLKKLKVFCLSPDTMFDKLDPIDRDLLEDQYTTMERYSRILDARIKRFLK